MRGYNQGGLPLIDWSNPLTGGLLSCVIAAMPGVMFDVARLRPRNALVKGVPHVRRLGASTGEGWAVGKSDGSDTTDLNWTSGPFTAAVFCNITDRLNYPQPLSRRVYTNESTNSGWELQVRPVGGQGRASFLVYNNNSVASYSLQGTTDTGTGDMAIAGTSDATTRRIFLNGEEEASTTSNPVPASASIPLRSETYLAGYSTYIGAMWNRCLLPVDVANWSNDPFQFLIYPEDELFATLVGVAAGGGGTPEFTKQFALLGVG